MSDVRAAAESLRDHAWLERFRKANYDNSFNLLSPTACNDIARYVDKFIDTVLAEHPADDETPITELWWCDMNGGSRFMFSSDERLMLYLAVDGMIELCVTNGLREISYKLQHIKTRGDVRRLCRALGVEVKE